MFFQEHIGSGGLRANGASKEKVECGLSCATLWYGGHLIIAGRMDGESLIPFVLYQLSLGDSLQGMGAVYTGSVSV